MKQHGSVENYAIRTMHFEWMTYSGWFDIGGAGGCFFFLNVRYESPSICVCCRACFLNSPKDNRDPFLVEVTGEFSFWRWNSPICIAKGQNETSWTGIVLFCLCFPGNRGNCSKKKDCAREKANLSVRQLEHNGPMLRCQEKRNTESHNIGVEWSWNMVQRADSRTCCTRKIASLMVDQLGDTHENYCSRRERKSSKRKLDRMTHCHWVELKYGPQRSSMECEALAMGMRAKKGKCMLMQG